MAQEKFTFQTEVSKLLDIVAHSLYSHKEIFLRELVSNASDACDRLRYEALTSPGLIEGDGEFKITLSFDKDKRTLSVADNGIGMNRDDLLETLGTIARSGTQAFVDRLSGDADKDVSLIGQFGVGFYSAFMVSDQVTVLTRRAGEDRAWLWSSDGKGEVTVDEGERPGRGTTVTLHMAEGEDEFLEASRIRHIVTTYSDHIGIPIVLTAESGEDTLNTASALWTRDRKDITDDQYKEFYHHAAHAFDEPWLTLHNNVEGVLSYINLLFVPSTKPFDLFNPERKHHVKLYVKRVYITDDCEGLLPGYLRFLRGIVDSEDLSLNISREMLQKDPKLAKIKSGLVKRVIGELEKKAEKAVDEYNAFWGNFGAVLKEGLYEDFENRERLMGLVRFNSTAGEGLVGLEDYLGRMKEGQEAIYYITGDDAANLAASPQLEGYKARGLEVLLLTDPVDDFWTGSVGAYKEKPFKSVTRGHEDLDKVAEADDAKKDGNDAAKDKETPQAEGFDTLLSAFKDILGAQVKDVRASKRLTDSAVCLVADEGDMDMHLERLLKAHQQMGDGAPTPRILEVNPTHGLITRLSAIAAADGGKDPVIGDAAHLLLDQARIVEGEPVFDAVAFSRRLASMMEKGLAG